MTDNVPSLLQRFISGCIGINLNPGSISWTYVDYQGNLKAKGQITLHLSGKGRGQAEAIIGDAISQLTAISNIATAKAVRTRIVETFPRTSEPSFVCPKRCVYCYTYACPIVGDSLDFSRKPAVRLQLSRFI